MVDQEMAERIADLATPEEKAAWQKQAKEAGPNWSRDNAEALKAQLGGRTDGETANADRNIWAAALRKLAFGKF